MGAFKDQAAVDRALGSNAVAKAFELIAKHPDLRHVDLPSVEKKTLEAIGRDRGAARAFVLGAVSPSVSIRRFVRKYGPKLGPGARGPLLELALESLDPFRGSAIARHVESEKLSTAPPREPAVYSEAAKYAREAMENVVFLVSQVDGEALVRLHELSDAFVRCMQTTAKFAPPFALAGVVSDEAPQLLRKDAALQARATLRWARGRFALDEPGDDPAFAAMAERLRSFGDVSHVRALLPARVSFHGLATREDRVALQRALRERLASPDLDKRYAPFLERELGRYHDAFPEEAREAAAAAVEGAAAAEAVGPSARRMVDGLAWLAFRLGLDDLARRIEAELDEDDRTDDEFARDSRTAAKPGEAKVLEQAHAFVLAERKKRPGARPRTSRFDPDHSEFVPGSRLDAAPFGEALAAILERFAAEGPVDEVSSRYLATCASLLPSRALARVGERLLGREPLEHHGHKEVLETLADREVAPPAFVKAVFAYRYPDGEPRLGDEWQLGLALLHYFGGDEGRAAALALASEFPLPSGKWAHDDRKNFYPAWQALIWSAWQDGSHELVAVALERLALPYYRKGDRALVPEVARQLRTSGYAARTLETGGVPLEEVVARVVARAPRRVPAIVANALASVEHADLARLALVALARSGGADAIVARRDDAFALLESARPANVSGGLELLAALPAIAGGREEEAVAAAERALGSSSSGTAQEAAATLAALATAWPAQRDRVREALEGALSLETPAVLQAVLRALEGVGASTSAAERLRELAKDDPKRFGKLVEKLLLGKAPAKKPAPKAKKPAPKAKKTSKRKK